MDALGHVNNTLYFRYMEQARLEWLYALVAGDNPYDTESGPLIVNASCTFLEAITYPMTLEVVMLLGDPGRTGIGSFYEILAGGRRVAEGAARTVWVTSTDRRRTPLPDTVRALVPATDLR
jgi:acyl-CoA thioester hydrolase